MILNPCSVIYLLPWRYFDIYYYVKTRKRIADTKAEEKNEDFDYQAFDNSVSF